MEDFHELGYKIYEKYFDESVFQTASNEILKYCFDIFSLTQTLSIGIGVKEGFSEIVQRQLGRYEIKIDISRLPLFCHSYIYDFIEKMNKIPRNIFKDVEFHLIHFSCVISMPGTQSQTWHVDGPHLSLDEYLPCHCFNIFVPFVDLTFDNGPTQIRPKSQFLTRNMKQLFTPALLLAKLESIVTPCLSKGSILVFDYRVLHRGLANKARKIENLSIDWQNSRPILVLTFAKSNFRDVLNFPKRSIYD